MGVVNDSCSTQSDAVCGEARATLTEPSSYLAMAAMSPCARSHHELTTGVAAATRTNATVQPQLGEPAPLPGPLSASIETTEEPGPNAPLSQAQVAGEVEASPSAAPCLSPTARSYPTAGPSRTCLTTARMQVQRQQGMTTVRRGSIQTRRQEGFSDKVQMLQQHNERLQRQWTRKPSLPQQRHAAARSGDIDRSNASPMSDQDANEPSLPQRTHAAPWVDNGSQPEIARPRATTSDQGDANSMVGRVSYRLSEMSQRVSQAKWPWSNDDQAAEDHLNA